jgi:hypothetical protein
MDSSDSPAPHPGRHSILSSNLSDVGRSRAALSEGYFTDKLAADLVEALDSGDFEFNDWQLEFLESNLGRSTYSVKQKKVIYEMANERNLI